MTRQSTFKQKIRARMKKTGERYAAARLALLRQAGGPPSALDIDAFGGYCSPSAVHGDTARLCAALHHAGVVDPATGEPFTEAALFALSGGIGFMTFLFEYKGLPPMLTFVCRSWSMPWPMIDRALRHAVVACEVKETGGAKGAQTFLDKALDENRVVHLTVDGASLPWRGADPQWKGQSPRQLNVIGRDGDRYLVDDGRWRVVDRDTLADARAAVRKQKHRAVVFDGHAAEATADDRLRQAMTATVETLTVPPFAGFTSAFGLNGLHKASQLTQQTKDKKAWSRVFNTPPLAALALMRTWQCIQTDYTPPAAGRPFYAEGLRQLANADVAPQRHSAAHQAADLAERSAEQWEALAELARAADPAVEQALALGEQMEELQSQGDDGDRVRALRKERDQALEASALNDAERAAVFTEVGAHFARIADLESALVEVLGAAV